MDVNTLKQAFDSVSGALPSMHGGCAMILGSGWSDASAGFEIGTSIDYSCIPGLGKTRVAGHEGQLHAATCGHLPVLVFHGRRHFYEGTGWEPVAIPVYLALKLGVKTLLLTNAAGGIREDLEPGNLMVVEDHINAMGSSPLQGPHEPDWGPRFPDQSEVYSTALRDTLFAAARKCSVPLKRGVYAASAGPSYETPAEIRMLAGAGADAVGMSTVPEAMLASAAGLRVAALSCISNRAAGTGPGALSHEEVIETTRRIMPSMAALLSAFCLELCENEATDR